MAKKQTTPTLETIDLASLHDVTGGRISHSSQPDPQVLQSLKSLGELIGQVGTQKQQAEAQSSQQMMGMMQQMMQKRQGG